LSAAVWFGGPYVAWNDVAFLAAQDKRLYVIASLLLLWLLKQLMTGLLAVNPFRFNNATARENLKPLQNQFNGAMQFLKKTIITKHHKQVRLNQLPWYLLIGPENAGKTSLLANSTVNYILQRQFPYQNMQKLEPSENCNWWVTRDASIIDVPGKYMLPGDKTSKYAFWKFLLRLINKQRGKNGVDGVVLALALPEWLAENDTKTYQAITRGLFLRLYEFKKHFPKTIPCYLLITKCDLLPGFADYFAELGNDETAQAWGVMLPTPPQGETIYDLFSQRFNALIKKLNQQLLWRLHQERNPAARPAIKDFPLHVERLKQFTHDFIKKFTEAGFNLSLQGVYLTSALQIPKEPVIHLLDDYSPNNRAIQLFKEPSVATRAYFIKQFITHGLMSVQPSLAPINKKFIWKRRFAYAASLGAIGLTAFFLGRDFKMGVNKAYAIQHHLSEYRLAIQSFQNLDEHLLKTTILLDTLQKSIKHEGFQLDLAHLLSFYSNQSQEKAALVYQEALQTILLPEVKKYLEDYLTLPINKNLEGVYTVLKTYLMLGDFSHLQPDVFLNTFVALLPKDINQTTLAHLMEHLTTAINQIRAPMPLNAGIIQATRNYLTSVPNAELGYIILKNINSNQLFSEINLGLQSPENVSLSGTNASSQLPLMFTAKTLGTILNQEINTAATEAVMGNWVLGQNPHANSAIVAQLGDDLRTLYITNYISAWEKLIDNVHLNEAKTLEQTDTMILNLTSSESPLLQLLEALHNNTYFEPIANSSPKLESLGVLTDKNSDANNLLFQIFSSLRLVHQYLQPIIQSEDQQKAAFDAISYRIVHNDKPDAITQVRIIADRSPEPIKSWLNQLSNNAWHLLMSNASLYLNTTWENEVLRPYQADIADHYPFNPKAKQEVNLQEFTAFFGGRGSVANFYRNVLAPLVDTSQPEWHWKQFGNEKLPLNEECLRLIQQAMHIQRVFYPNGDNKLAIQFAIEPYQFGKTVKRVQLSINDKQIVDEDTKVRTPHVIMWPNNGKAKMTALNFTLKNKSVIHRQYPGDWGWFKLVSATYESAITKKQSLLNLSSKETPVKYYLYTDGQENPFLSLNMKQFNLPEKIID